MKFIDVKEGTFGKLDNRSALTFVTEFNKVFNEVLNLKKFICLESEFEDDLPEDVDFYDIQLDELDEFSTLAIGENTPLGKFIYSGLLGRGRVNEFYSMGYKELTVIHHLTQKYADAYVPLNVEQIGELRGYVERATANLAYAFNLQFEIINIISAIKEGSEIQIMQPLYDYIANSGLQVEEYCSAMFEISKSNPPYFEAFEKYPELADKFLEKVPELLVYDVLENSEKITKKIMEDVVSGKKVVDELFIEEELKNE